MSFLKSFTAWIAFTCVPPLVLYLSHDPLFRKSDLLFLLPFFLIPTVGCIALWLPIFGESTTRKDVLAGLLLGLILPF